MTAQRIKQTSVDAYYAMIAGPKLGEQQRAIVAYLARNCHRDFTRAELAQYLGLRVSSVCGRVNELLEQQAVVETPRRKCSVTGSSAHPLKLAPAQIELFGEAA